MKIYSTCISNLATPTLTIGSSVADYNGDDHLDLLILNLLEPNQLFESTGDGGFVDVSVELGIIQERHYYRSATWGDVDNDGDLDPLILTSNTGTVEPPPWEDTDFEPSGPNQMYINDGGNGFTLTTLANHDPEPYSCCAAFVDANLDFKQDLYIVNDFGMYVEPNQLFFNDGEGDLRPHEGSGIDVGMFGMGLAVGAFNDDDIRTLLPLIGDGIGYCYPTDLEVGTMQPNSLDLLLNSLSNMLHGVLVFPM